MQKLLSLWAMLAHRAQWVCVFNFCLASGVWLIGCLPEIYHLDCGEINVTASENYAETMRSWLAITDSVLLRAHRGKTGMHWIQQDLNCHSRHFCPLPYFSHGRGGANKQTKISLTRQIFLSFTVGAKWSLFFCVDMKKKIWSCFWWDFLCGRETEITFGTQIDYK